MIKNSKHYADYLCLKVILFGDSKYSYEYIVILIYRMNNIELVVTFEVTS